MRSIKFRVWNKYRNAWDYSFVIGSDGALWFRTGAGNEYCETMNKPSDDMMLDLEVVQFTGILDCDGKEIYEGDVLYMPEERNDNGDVGNLYVVKFTEGAFWGVLMDNKDDYELLNDINDHCELVDNIFESPELLEVK